MIKNFGHKNNVISNNQLSNWCAIAMPESFSAEVDFIAMANDYCRKYDAMCNFPPESVS